MTNTAHLPSYMKWDVATVSIPQGSWRYGRRCEIRAHRVDRNPKGRDHDQRVDRFVSDLDRRYYGTRSAYGRELARLRKWAAQRTLQEVNDHRHMWE